MAGLRPFQRCAVAGSPEMMKWLLEQYGDIIKPELPKLSNAGISWALASVFEENAAEMLELLLENGAALNIDDGSWMPTPMRKIVPLRLLFFKCIVPNNMKQQRPSALVEHFGNALATTPLGTEVAQEQKEQATGALRNLMGENQAAIAAQIAAWEHGKMKHAQKCQVTCQQAPCVLTAKAIMIQARGGPRPGSQGGRVVYIEGCTDPQAHSNCRSSPQRGPGQQRRAGEC